MAYGVANRTGCPDEQAASALVGQAYDQGVSCFDTASAYGRSEAVLGRAFADLGLREAVQVVSKGGDFAATGGSLTACVQNSLTAVGVPRLAAWLLHDEQQLSAWNDRTQAEADALIAADQVGVFGVSVYHPDIACRALDDFGFGALQFPSSPFDRRFLRGDKAARILASGAQLFVRSVYLQGLGLMDPAQVPEHIHHGKEAVASLADFCRQRGLQRDHFCVQYVLQRTAQAKARLVIGVETPEQLRRNHALFTAPAIPAAYLDEWDQRWPDDIEDLVLPYRWAASARS
ncbi:MAG: aldo/keto reductase [Opitutus sp.]|nr:aldo/keto reductase [Opitutus sp.]